MPDFERLLTAIDVEADDAYGSDTDSTLASDRAFAIDQYLGKNTIPAPEGRSQVVDRSVFETIQWILPSLIDIFANGDDVVALPPIGPGDEEASKQEAQYLNHIALNKSPWLEICLTWFVDAMLTRNAYVYAYREYKRSVSIEEYESQTEEGLAMLVQDGDVEIVEQNAYQSEDEQEPVIGQDGQPVMQLVGVDPMGGPILEPAMQPKMLYDVTLRRTEKEGKFCIDVLPPERCLVSMKTPTFRVLERCPYFEYYEFKTLSDLRAEGFDVEDDINDEADVDTQEDLARDTLGERSWAGERKPSDPAMRRVKARTIWIQYDYDEDGIAEMNRVIRVGREVLERKEVGRIHIASIVPIPMPHRHMGLSVADIVKDLQDIKTAILRGGLDNLYLSNNPRTFANDKINLDDLMISRPGGIVRGEAGSVYGQDIGPIQVPFVFPQAMEGLEYMDQVRENRTGTNRYFTGIDQNAMNKTATGIQQLTSMAAQRVKLIARIFASGFRDLFDILHELVLKSGHKQEVIKLKGNWVPIDPAEWKKRNDFSIQVGYAAGNKDAMVNHLMLIADLQGKALQSGLPIVTPDNMYQTAIELTKASDFSTPERFWTDPSQAGPRPPPPPDPVIEATKIKAGSDEKIKQAELQQKAGQSEDELLLEKYKIDKDAEVKIVIEQMKGGQAVDIEHHRAALNPKTTEANTAAKKVKGEQDFMQALGGFMQQFAQSQQQQTQTLTEIIKGALEGLNAPRESEVVRDKSGKVVKVVSVRPSNGS